MFEENLISEIERTRLSETGCKSNGGHIAARYVINLG